MAGYATPGHGSEQPGEDLITEIVYHDGSIYIGAVMNGRKHGPGRFIGANGSEYNGEFSNDVPHGTGTYTHADGERKRVVFKDGRLVSSSLMPHLVTSDGCRFGVFESIGRYTGWFKGNRIKGFIPHGRGIMRYVNGSVYTGQWDNGTMHGNGTIEWSEGSVYTGQWVRGKRTGFGTYTWANGNRYIGQWKDNQICGTGIFYHRDGRIERGSWKEKTISATE